MAAPAKNKKKFSEKDILDALFKNFGFKGFKGEQELVVKNLLEGNDTFVIMPTGGGKSMCYQLPAMMLDGTAIIISPLIALMKNQVDSMRTFGMEDGIAHFLNSSLNKAEIMQVKEDITKGLTKLLYVAPESLTKQENIDFLKGVNISFVAIDEAHCISEWGHDFRPEYRRLRPIIEEIGVVPIIALTATATPKVQQDIQKNLGMSEATVFKASFNRGNLYYEVRSKGPDVVKDIIKYIKGHAGKSGIIYCLSRKRVEEVAESLLVNGIKAQPYHAGLEPKVRAANQDAFLMEDAEVIVATIAFGMGIDKPDVRFVIHVDIPKSLEGYYQETGRAGRDGGEGNCVTYYSYEDIQKLEKFMKGKPVAEQEIGKMLIQETVAYAETSNCRRKVLLNYFGETYDDVNCGGMCDNCRFPKEKFEGKDAMLLVLETVVTLNDKFKDKHIANVILGVTSSAVKQYKHNELEIFGDGGDESERYWISIIRQALVNGFLSKDIENYGLLKPTQEGLDFIKKPTSIMLTVDHDFDNEEDESDFIGGGGKGGGGDETLFSLLKDLRKTIAKNQKLPPFVIFQDPSLEDMSIQYPITLEEIKNCSGVGAGKAQKFGKPFIELIAKYVEENEIHRPMDMVVKSIVNKSGLKVYIIQSIDRKLDIEDIALAKGMGILELLDEIETIVSSGTKLDLNYFINEVIDEDKQEEVFEYFNTAETDSVEDALRVLGEDEYNEVEIRLMRIKFMSELGN